MKNKTYRHHKFSDYKKELYAKDPTMEARVNKEYLKLVNAELKVALKEKAVLERIVQAAINHIIDSGYCENRCPGAKKCMSGNFYKGKTYEQAIRAYFKAKAKGGR